MDKFYGGLDRFITKEVQRRVSRRIANYGKLQADNIRLDKELVKARVEIRKLQNELQKALETSVKQAKQELSGGFAVGEKVWTTDYKSEKTVCQKCNGEKKVKAIIGGVEEEIKCPSCDYGYHHRSYIAPMQDEIRAVYITIGNGTHIKYWLRKSDREVEQGKIFKTQEECQRYCDEQNAKR